MKKAAIAQRKAINASLLKRDAENRCATCKRNLLECGQIIQDFLLPGRFCSDECMDEARKAGNA